MQCIFRTLKKGKGKQGMRQCSFHRCGVLHFRKGSDLLAVSAHSASLIQLLLELPHSMEKKEEDIAKVPAFVISTMTEAFGAPEGERHIYMWRKSMNTPPRATKQDCWDSSTKVPHLPITDCSFKT